jgi:plasmid stabilization system protein ParE
MEFEVIWTEPAAEQLEQVIRYIAADRPVAADQVRADILTRVESLSALPFMGAVYEKDRTGRAREIPCGRYRLFYRVDEPARRVEVFGCLAWCPPGAAIFGNKPRRPTCIRANIAEYRIGLRSGRSPGSDRRVLRVGANDKRIFV